MKHSILDMDEEKLLLNPLQIIEDKYAAKGIHLKRSSSFHFSGPVRRRRLLTVMGLFGLILLYLYYMESSANQEKRNEMTLNDLIQRQHRVIDTDHIVTVSKQPSSYEPITQQENIVVQDNMVVQENIVVQDDVESDIYPKKDMSQDTPIIPPSDTPSSKQPVKIIHISIKNTLHPESREAQVINTWKRLHPEWQVLTYDDTAMRQLVVEKYAEFLHLYDSLLDSVERVDMWRYLVVHAYGGIYADSDWRPLVKVEEWHDRILPGVYNPDFYNNNKQPHQKDPPNVIVGFEKVDGPFVKSVQIFQWGFYSRYPHHPLFYNVVSHIQDKFVNELMTSNYDGDAVARTGPIPFTWAVLRYLQQHQVPLVTLDKHENFRLESDILIAKDSYFDWDGRLAVHLYSGSWKMDQGRPAGSHPSEWREIVDPETGNKMWPWQVENKSKFKSLVEKYWNAQVPSL